MTERKRERERERKRKREREREKEQNRTREQHTVFRRLFVADIAIVIRSYPTKCTGRRHEYSVGTRNGERIGLVFAITSKLDLKSGMIVIHQSTQRGRNNCEHKR